MANFPSLQVWAVSSPAMAYVYYGVMRLPKGHLRLAASLPLIAFYVFVAKGFDTVFERSIYSFFFIWLTSFKIVLLCWDDGPASDPWAIASFPRFLAVMNLSLQIKREKFSQRLKGHRIKSKSRDSNSAAIPSDVALNGNESKLTEPQKPTKSSWRSLLKSVDGSLDWHMVVLRLLFKFVVVLLITCSYAYRSSMPLGLLYVIYSFHIYIVASLIFEGIAAIVSPMMGIELEAAFDKPFLAHSLSDFWGKRWNLLVSNLMRVSIYDPMLRFLLWNQSEHHSRTEPSNGEQSRNGPPSTISTSIISKPPLWARSIAMMAAFLTSGLMHELIFHNMTRQKPTWQVTVFFTLHGAATLLELAIRRKVAFRPSKWISTPLTLGFTLLTAVWYFYPPLVDSGTAEAVIDEFTCFFQKLHQSVVGLVGGS
ncbi:acyl-CoA--sterol O-acyltransferase 1 [Physcomitrium patens]|uniref:Wax synthase domain-containing protein n=1 Tax=Physcomitrium patens TaxID=3218 RepID=A0A2K1KTZ9_PHYPA|nr:acyl-CoA--sterol O-acyltransferase 1-like [Physcomitrium patens]PNR57230.1 hypothetical protein PHYPA_004223 [Physcomitrium patens]|eukprot:XP_024369341.1 acyl-CoA--sterol O-acyltransferase 1-like [Physcomitrella patens]